MHGLDVVEKRDAKPKANFNCVIAFVGIGIMSNYLFDEKVPQLTFQKIKSPRPILALLQCTKTALLRANTQISESMRDKERCIS